MQLEDMRGEKFGEGDYVLFSTSKGLRVAKVRGIKPGRVAVEIVRARSSWTTIGAKYSLEYRQSNFYKLHSGELDNAELVV